MKIVIEIDDNLYTRLFDNGDEYVADMRRACVAIRKGMPLPKGHGKIIDVNEIVYETECRYMSDGCCTTNRVPNIYAIPAIIEADTESEVKDD